MHPCIFFLPSTKRKHSPRKASHLTKTCSEHQRQRIRTIKNPGACHCSLTPGYVFQNALVLFSRNMYFHNNLLSIRDCGGDVRISGRLRRKQSPFVHRCDNLIRAAPFNDRSVIAGRDPLRSPCHGNICKAAGTAGTAPADSAGYRDGHT